MDAEDSQSAVKFGWLTKILIKPAGVDEITLGRCPPHDWSAVRAVGGLLVCAWIYQTGLFSIMSYRLFASAGQIRPDLIAIAMFLATFILFIDSYMVMRSGWHLNGIEELKRGGDGDPDDVECNEEHIGGRCSRPWFQARKLHVQVGTNCQSNGWWRKDEFDQGGEAGEKAPEGAKRPIAVCEWTAGVRNRRG